METLRARKPVAILPVGAVEAHGPHLPLETDTIIADEMARRAAAALEGKGLPVLVLPKIAYSVTEFGAAFPGTVSIRPGSARSVLWDVCASVAAMGFRCVLIANAHLEPAHREVLRDTAERGTKELGIPVVFPDIVRRRAAERLTEEFRSGACHAGRFETSLVLAVRPDLVKDDIRAGLDPNWTNLAEKIQKGAATFEEAGGPDAYFGDPRAATAEEGESTYGVLTEILVGAALEALPGAG